MVHPSFTPNVVLLAEDVDRNFKDDAMDAYLTLVVLLAEDVDRNINAIIYEHNSRVVLLAEDVDRNIRRRFMRKLRTCRPPRGGRG